MLTEIDIKKLGCLDEAAEHTGGYVAVPRHPHIVDYDYRAMSKYAKSKGLKSIELTEEEQDMFKFDPPLIYG